tara:strand:+ start:286 stop:426 length:141 start_codon:yes stop_codon:yes gene_type:complete
MVANYPLGIPLSDGEHCKTIAEFFSSDLKLYKIGSLGIFVFHGGPF